jgi:F1F0 ATPase subunit 2
MSELLPVASAFLAGALLGLIFFGGLWWTIKLGATSESPAAWFILSLLLRTGMILAAFWFIAQGDWSRLVSCLVGFLIARVLLVNRLTRTTSDTLKESE